MFRKIATLTFVLCVPALLWAQTAENKPIVKKGSAPVTNSSNGTEMFASYCSPCHGKSGRGDGPAAAALTPKPADLTGFTKRHGGGAFPAKDFEDKLNGMAMSKAHGSTDMPVWGPILRQMGNEPLRVYNLTEYVKSIQVQ